MANSKIIVKYQFNKKISRKFYLFHLLKNSFFMYLVFGLGVFSLVLLLTNENEQESTLSYYLSWSVCILGILFIPLYLLLSAAMATRRESKERKDTEETYELTKDKIVRSDNKSSQKLVLNWYQISKVYETNDAFYFYSANDSAFIFSKTGIIEGTVENLRFLINSYLKKDNKGRIPYIVKDKEYLKELKEYKKAAKKNDSLK